MKITLFAVLFLSLYVSTLGGDSPPSTNVTICIPPITSTPYYTIVCPNGDIAGYFVDADCKVVNKSCPDSGSPVPPPPPVFCLTCPTLTADRLNGSTNFTNYLCKDGQIGGPACNYTLCRWYVVNCDAVSTAPKTGYCPAVNPAQQCSTTPNAGCLSDLDCDSDKKCCADTCGPTCKTPDSSPIEDKDGYCPDVTATSDNGGSDIGLCDYLCTTDGDCTDTSKCCSTDCGGTGCMAPKNSTNGPPAPCTPIDCLYESTLDTLDQTPQVCPDGSLATTFCERVQGLCKPVFHTCPDVVPPIVHRGFCPAVVVSSTVDPNINCTSACKSDNDCDADKKCCVSGQCPSNLACVPAVSQKCVASGYRKMLCLDSSVASTLYPNGNPSSPDNNVTLPEACYRCIEKAVCASNNGTCGWDNNFSDCISKCNSATTTAVNCVSRTLCDCTDDSQCSWCQFRQAYVSSIDQVARNVTFGVCVSKGISNKCTGDSSSAGYGGSCVYSQPENCSSSDLPPAVRNPTGVITDHQIKDIINSTCNGTFSAGTFQDTLRRSGVVDIEIGVIGQSTCNTTAGNIIYTVTVTGGKSKTDIISNLTNAIASCFNLKISQVSTTLDDQQGSTKKRQTSSSSFLGTSTVSSASSTTTPVPQPTSTPTATPTGTITPTSPSSGYLLAPVWLLSLISLFLMR